MTTKPTILFIHGAWHTPAAYGEFLAALQSRGYEVVAPELPSNDFKKHADPPGADVAYFAEVARSLADQGKEILCVMHSYGGAVGTEAMHGLGIEERQAKGLKGGVKRLAYVCAFMLTRGHTLDEAAPEIFDYEGDQKVFREDQDIGAIFYPELSQAEQAERVRAMVPHAKACSFHAPAVAAYDDIPSTFVYCTLDRAFTYEAQKGLIAALTGQGVKVDTVTLEAGHFPTASMPENCADVVLQWA